mmetsp:Transcript_1704/g.6001  ORF Transcript_1704/g.6001 Transcript_1704/m.6001 type:complete len:202 (+) Transcript_1704:909-1514(+)
MRLGSRLSSASPPSRLGIKEISVLNCSTDLFRPSSFLSLREGQRLIPATRQARLRVVVQTPNDLAASFRRRWKCLRSTSKLKSLLCPEPVVLPVSPECVGSAGTPRLWSKLVTSCEGTKLKPYGISVDLTSSRMPAASAYFSAIERGRKISKTPNTRVTWPSPGRCERASKGQKMTLFRPTIDAASRRGYSAVLTAFRSGT